MFSCDRLSARLLATTVLQVSAAVCAASGPTPTSSLSPELAQDVSVLEHAYAELHPGLLRYLTPAELERTYAALRLSLARDPSLAGQYLAYARFTAALRCGHTYPNFYNQTPAVQATLFEGSPRLPFHFRWLDRRMVVTEDDTARHALPVGSVVERINGVATRDILKRLLPLTRADGANDAKRMDQLSVRGDALYEAFDVYYPLSFEFPAGVVRLTVREPGSRVARTVRVPTLSYEERTAALRARRAAELPADRALFDWDDHDRRATVLRMPTWAVYDSGWDWRGWLEAHLDQLVADEVPALVIDLRGNEGGEAVGDVILRRLLAADLELPSTARLVRYRKVADDLAPYLRTWDASFRDWGERAAELAAPWPTAPAVSYYALQPAAGSDAARVLHPDGTRYRGRVYVLVDAAVSSATFQFAQTIQQAHLGTLVGVPTGGNRRGINGGAFFFLQLPHSQIELDLPLVGTFPDHWEPDAGLVPDVVTHPTAADVAAGIDVDQAAVRRLLGR